MEQILNLIRKYSCCCLNCGSLSSDAGCLCESCQNILERRKSEGPREISRFKVISLYQWNPGESDLLSRLILWLKGSRQEQAWKFYAQRLVQQEFQPESVQRIVVPAPGKNGQVDHAYLWGKSLATALGAEFLPCLGKSGTFSQRGADRGMRALIEMELVENSTQAVTFSTQTQWIFADDILTTGATARAAHRALGNPTNFQVWTLAQRSLSCGASGDLL